MLRLSQTTGHAVRALSCIAFNEGVRLFARDIAKCTGVPPAYLSKILSSLTECGLLDAKRGYRGGVKLTRNPADISLLEVVEAVEGYEWTSNCLLGLVECDDSRSCPTHAFWKVERRRIQNELSSITLADVAEYERRHGTMGSCVAVVSVSEETRHRPGDSLSLRGSHPMTTEVSEYDTSPATAGTDEERRAFIARHSPPPGDPAPPEPVREAVDD
jgi:Rrf2 family protein